MSTPTNVRMFGWIRSATHAAMIARSGNMQIVPMRPVKVMTASRGGRSVGVPAV